MAANAEIRVAHVCAFVSALHFKGDASNLYRYCGNDWANRTDPMGLVGDTVYDPKWQQEQAHGFDGMKSAQKQQQPQQQKNYWALGNDRAKSIRLDPHGNKPVNEQYREGNVATYEHVFVSAAPFMNRSTANAPASLPVSGGNGLNRKLGTVFDYGEANRQYGAYMATHQAQFESEYKFVNAVYQASGVYSAVGLSVMAAVDVPVSAAPKGGSGINRKIGIELLKFVFRIAVGNEGPPPTPRLPAPGPPPIEGAARVGVGTSPMFNAAQVPDDQ